MEMKKLLSPGILGTIHRTQFLVGSQATKPQSVALLVCSQTRYFVVNGIFIVTVGRVIK
jgi:hypothetical protein